MQGLESLAHTFGKSCTIFALFVNIILEQLVANTLKRLYKKELRPVVFDTFLWTVNLVPSLYYLASFAQFLESILQLDREILANWLVIV